jgi:hypothetical protein
MRARSNPNALTVALLLAATALPPTSAGAEEGAPLPNLSARPEGDGPRERRWREGDLALPIAETLAINAFTMSWNRYVGAAPWADVDAGSVGRNLRSEWVLDQNQFWVNQFGHPYQGTWAFTAARSSGQSFWGSVPFVFGASALWELAGETERPALNDQVTTTVAGVVLGEILHRFAGALRAEGGPWRDAFASVLSPMGALNRRALGAGGDPAAPPSRWQLALGTVAVEGLGPTPGGWRPLGYGGLSFTYGLPGAADLELDRPFDHFVVEAGYGMASDPDATLRARGLLVGRAFGAAAVRGLYGAWLSFDLDTPPRHRVSTSAVGFGGSASADLGGGLSVEGDAIASVVLLGAGGNVDREPAVSGESRDYRFGPGAQGLAGVRFLAGSRGSAGLALRQYLLLGAGDDSGSTELLVEGSAAATLRIAGAHGVGVEVSRYLRRAHADGVPSIRHADSVVRIYYTLMGGFAGRTSRPLPSGPVAGARRAAPGQGS